MSDESAQKRAQVVNPDDVDEILGLAAKLRHSTQDQLTVDDLKSVAQEVDISPEYIEKAMSELARRKEELRVAKEKRQRVLRNAAIGTAVFLVIFGIFSWVGVSTSQGLYTTVEQKRSLVREALDRQQRVATRVGTNTDDGSMAELAGAENRVSIAKRRYDDAVSAYNSRSGSFPGSLWSRMGGLPSRVMFSREGVTW